MNPQKISIVAVLALLLTGCGVLPRTDTERQTLQLSNHTIQELCDFPKQFFSARYNAPNLEVSVTATKPMNDKIAAGNGCGYHTPGRKEYLGDVFLHRIFEDTTSPTIENRPARVLKVDGVAVTETVEPIPDYLDPATARPYFELTANIDGWEGTLEFKNGDDQGTQAGAQVLVNMIRALKG
ncbi:hypothetical protein OHA40_25715 [Nocardia sp. NBC_00508]|uniref:hypothetical protein n=1 Tax=Nocardia sp. NBC_00508 TaxID=2975992 RepID=UPI002E7FFBF5|nr:hypothetical protein [Nocardia sp. NBC_00508]WUD65032.1 hypothetical protein OHA40_25715 [Nocardia sp. NBC_00508]